MNEYEFIWTHDNLMLIWCLTWLHLNSIKASWMNEVIELSEKPTKVHILCRLTSLENIFPFDLISLVA